MQSTELPIIEFKSEQALRLWLVEHHASSAGVWIRIYKKHAKVESVTFEQVLDQGLCFGWSESKRRKYDDDSYLQQFTPRKTKGTQSERNKKRAQALIEAGQMTQAGLDSLGFMHDG